MMTIANPRRRAGQRVSSALWGLLVAGVGVLMISAYSGYGIDLELTAIIVLGAIGGWLVLSALVSGIGRKREVARATAPTVEEPVAPHGLATEDGNVVAGDSGVAGEPVEFDEFDEDDSSESSDNSDR